MNTFFCVISTNWTMIFWGDGWSIHFYTRNWLLCGPHKGQLCHGDSVHARFWLYEMLFQHQHLGLRYSWARLYVVFVYIYIYYIIYVYYIYNLYIISYVYIQLYCFVSNDDSGLIPGGWCWLFLWFGPLIGLAILRQVQCKKPAESWYQGIPAGIWICINHMALVCEISL